MEELSGMVATGRSAIAVERAGWSRRARKEVLAFHLFTLPWVLGFVCLAVVPLALGLATSFTNYDGLNLSYLKFQGAANYTRAFKSEEFWVSLRNSAKYALISVPVGLALSLLLAVLLNQRIKGRDFFRIIYYIPSVLPLAGAARAWALLFNQHSGLINAAISLVRPGTAIYWVQDYFYPILYLYDWWHVGGGMVLFLAGLQGIPVELHEAAYLDGANKVRAFWHITLPLITPVLFFQLIMGILGALQVMETPILVYGKFSYGQVNLPTDKYMYMIYIYSQTFDFQRFGYGVALSWIFFVIVLVMTLIVISTSRYWVYYEVAQERSAA